MPVHDWSRVDPGTFHNFHFCWLYAIMRRLNRGVLPAGFRALAEQYVHGPKADVVALRLDTTPPGGAPAGGPAALLNRPSVKYVLTKEPEQYARKANHIAVQHSSGEVVAVIEVVSPGNKSSRRAVAAFAEKANVLLDKGVNLLVVDILPPTNLAPQGIHPVIWGEEPADRFELDPAAPLTFAAYQASPDLTAYVEPAAVGRPAPPMPLFLADTWHVTVPLEETYLAAWDDQMPEVQHAVSAGPA